MRTTTKLYCFLLLTFPVHRARCRTSLCPFLASVAICVSSKLLNVVALFCVISDCMITFTHLTFSVPNGRVGSVVTSTMSVLCVPFTFATACILLLLWNLLDVPVKIQNLLRSFYRAAVKVPLSQAFSSTTRSVGGDSVSPRRWARKQGQRKDRSSEHQKREARPPFQFLSF